MAPASTMITSTTNVTVGSRPEKNNVMPWYVPEFTTGCAVVSPPQSETALPIGPDIEITASATIVMRFANGEDATSGRGRGLSRQPCTEADVVEAVPIPQHARVVLDELIALDGRSASEVLTRAIEEYWDRRLFEAGNAAYADLRQDPAAWDAYQAECAEWDGTLMDGLGISGGE
jgi:hypothetical protein